MNLLSDTIGAGRMRKSSLVSTLRRAIRECRLSFCMQCGVCSAVCSLPEVFDDLPYFALPRATVRRFMLSRMSHDDALALLGDARFWYCLTCDECARQCPAGVRLSEFAARMHRLAVAHGLGANAAVCPSCKTLFSTRNAVKRAAGVLSKTVDKKAAGVLPKAVSEKEEAQKDADSRPGVAQLLQLCPKCRRYVLARRIVGKRYELGGGIPFSPRIPTRSEFLE